MSAPRCCSQAEPWAIFLIPPCLPQAVPPHPSSGRCGSVCCGGCTCLFSLARKGATIVLFPAEFRKTRERRVSLFLNPIDLLAKKYIIINFYLSLSVGSNFPLSAISSLNDCNPLTSTGGVCTELHRRGTPSIKKGGGLFYQKCPCCDVRDRSSRGLGFQLLHREC